MNRLSRRQLARIAAVTGAIAAPALILPKWYDAQAGLVRADAEVLAKLSLAGHFGFGMIGGGGAAASTTLNPADKTPNALLSAGNLKLAPSGGGTSSHFKMARSIASKSTGKYYFEVYYPAVSGGSSVGLFLSDNAALSETSANPPLANTAGFTRGASGTHGFAFDAANKLWWWRDTTGTFTGNPAGGTGGTSWSWSGAVYVLATILGNDPSDYATWNFGASAFAYTPPAGFGTLG